jgi:hypothetical protein
MEREVAMTVQDENGLAYPWIGAGDVELKVDELQ